MIIDLSSYYKDDLAPKLEQIKQAIKESKCITFHYCYNKGEADKQIEPYLIVFKWSDWYVFGFCKERQDFRMYKLRRLWDLQIIDESFTARNIPEDKKQFGSHMTDDYIIPAIYDSSVKYRLVEEYGHTCFAEQEDGKLYTEWGFTTQKGAVEWFLSFGNKVKVLGPPEMVEIMKSTLDSIKNLYES